MKLAKLIILVLMCYFDENASGGAFKGCSSFHQVGNIEICDISDLELQVGGQRERFFPSRLLVITVETRLT